MNRHRTPVAASLALAVLAAVSHAPGAAAAEIRAISVSPTAICEAPLPVFNATLRKRPVAIANEGTAGIYVSCTLMTDGIGEYQGWISVSFRSAGPAANVPCTLVAGGTITQDFIPGSVNVPAGATRRLEWGEAHKRDPSGSYAFSCLLPAGIEMSTITFAQISHSNRL